MTTPTVTAAEMAGRPDAVEGACDTCPHALGTHDAISLRFCAATRASALPRGCVCPSA